MKEVTTMHLIIIDIKKKRGSGYIHKKRYKNTAVKAHRYCNHLDRNGKEYRLFSPTAGVY